MEIEQLMDVREVARVTNRHCETIREWLRQGRLPGRRIGHSWFVERAVLEKFIEQEAVVA